MQDIKVLKRNFRLFYLRELFSDAMFFAPIELIFGKQYLGLSYFEAGLFSIVYLLFSVGFDFIGGAFADKWGRRKAFIIGRLLFIGGFLPFIFTTSYPILLLGMAVAGIGTALGSSSLEALVYEYAVIAQSESYYRKANATAESYLFFGRVIAFGFGGIAYAISPTLPYLLYIIALICSTIAGIAMKFPANVTNKAVDTEHNLKIIIKEALAVYKAKKAMIHFLLIGGLFAFWVDMMFFYYQPYYVSLHVETSIIGFVYAALSIASMGGALLLRFYSHKISPHAIQSIELLLVIVTAAFLLFLGLPWVLLAPLAMGITGGLMYPNLSRSYAVTN